MRLTPRRRQVPLWPTHVAWSVDSGPGRYLGVMSHQLGEVVLQSVRAELHVLDPPFGPSVLIEEQRGTLIGWTLSEVANGVERRLSYASETVGAESDGVFTSIGDAVVAAEVFAAERYFQNLSSLDERETARWRRSLDAYISDVRRRRSPVEQFLDVEQRRRLLPVRKYILPSGIETELELYAAEQIADVLLGFSEGDEMVDRFLLGDVLPTDWPHVRQAARHVVSEFGRNAHLGVERLFMLLDQPPDPKSHEHTD